MKGLCGAQGENKTPSSREDRKSSLSASPALPLLTEPLTACPAPGLCRTAQERPPERPLPPARRFVTKPGARDLALASSRPASGGLPPRQRALIPPPDPPNSSALRPGAGRPAGEVAPSPSLLCQLPPPAPRSPSSPFLPLCPCCRIRRRSLFKRCLPLCTGSVRALAAGAAGSCAGGGRGQPRAGHGGSSQLRDAPEPLGQAGGASGKAYLRTGANARRAEGRGGGTHKVRNSTKVSETGAAGAAAGAGAAAPPQPPGRTRWSR